MKNEDILEHRLVSELSQSLYDEALEKAPDENIDENQQSIILAELIAGQLEEIGLLPDYDSCPHEDQGARRPCKVLGFSYSDDDNRLELITGLISKPSSFIPASEAARLSGWAARFFEYAAKGDLERFHRNASASEAASRIRANLDRIEEIRVHVVTNGIFRDRSVADITVLGRPVSTEVWDAERLLRVSGETVGRDRIEIDFQSMLGRSIPCLEVRPRPDEYETFLLILPGEVLFSLFERFGARLFEFNVRSFLQAKGAVNRGLQRTIRDEPGRFLAYNNGITATADEIEVGVHGGETVIRSIRGLQIVNGAQTTASIHRAKKADKVDISKVAVSLKLTKVPSDRLGEFVPLIARFANTQNPIQLADLAASERFHQQFESLADSTWIPGEESRWFYERARGSYQMERQRQGSTPARRREFDRMCPKGCHFGKTDLAKYLMTWWGFPHLVSKGAQKNHAAFMLELRERFGKWDPDREFYQSAIAIAIIFKAAQVSVRRAKLQSYAANVTAYLVAILAMRFGSRIDLSAIWQMQEISPELIAMMEGWAPLVHGRIVETAGVRNVTEWCKKTDCWIELQQLTLDVPASGAPEFSLYEDSSQASTPDGSEEGDQATLNCLALNGAEWTRVMAWAATSPLIEDFDRRVAHTIAGYALSGWNRTPTAKQAIRGARVLDAAKGAGVL